MSIEETFRVVNQAARQAFPGHTFSFNTRFFEKDSSAQITMSADRQTEKFFYVEGNGPDLPTALKAFLARFRDTIEKTSVAYRQEAEKAQERAQERQAAFVQALELLPSSEEPPA